MSPLRFFFRASAILLVLLLFAWAATALWVDGGRFGWFASVLILASAILVWRSRPFTRALAVVFCLSGCVFVWWFTLAPSNDRVWRTDVANLPSAVLDGSLLTIQNVRAFRYATDGAVEEHWKTQTYDLATLTGFDIFFSFWGPRAYGHTIASWEFADGRHLAISIETRKERDENFSPLRGFFRQFELYYVVSDELDVVAVRGVNRNEDMQLYRVYTPNDGARLLLLDYVSEINTMVTEPRWYNALTHNCTTTIWSHAHSIGSSFPYDWRLIANGYVLELAHELGTVNNAIELEELKRLSMVSAKVRSNAGVDADSRVFSAALRRDLPARPVGACAAGKPC